MLTLQREIGESCIICVPGYPPIRVLLVDIRNSKRGKLGFEAHSSITIHREEIYQRIAAGESPRRSPIEQEKSPHTEKASGASQAAR